MTHERIKLGFIQTYEALRVETEVVLSSLEPDRLSRLIKRNQLVDCPETRATLRVGYLMGMLDCLDVMDDGERLIDLTLQFSSDFVAVP
jgi:hypothetical protein